ncbi:VWA domain-containing protein [Georgenia wutianyii]|uniref:VWA domain-containing protein n=1 Tax=Georgenia wutianyii TaxID=2585135 RepID=A0ABX5VSQ2_9MICO|nr:vWA domain-containing protein [Georgenia wutianyii]QDB80219.1 VWA domain-containing protein [Georgenia wutianyii]
MKHGADDGTRRRTWRVAVTTLISLGLVASATTSVATGLDEDVAGGPSTTFVEPAQVLTPAAEGDLVLDGDAAPAPQDEAPAPAAPAPSAPAPVDAAPPAAPLTGAPSPAAANERAEASSVAAPAALAPLAVPAPTGNSAVITVKVGGDRSTTSAVAGLQGVRLRLHTGSSSPAGPVNESWASCVSDSAGDCSFVVPETQAGTRVCVEFLWGFCMRWDETPGGANYDRRFWVVQDSAPTGWYTNPALVTGGASSQVASTYAFRTGEQLRAATTYRAGSQFMTAGSSETRTGSAGTWQTSRANPRLTQTCEAGLDVALVLDLSGSVANAGAVGDLKASAIAFAEALQGTGSRIALFTFAETAPRANGSSGQNYPTLLPVDGNLATIRDRINAYSAGGGTNWDRGIHQVAQNGQQFDLAIVVTDGQATYSGNPATGPGSFTRFSETEQAIFSANGLKAKGTRVLAVGVGGGIGGDAANLRAVSGPSGHAPGASANSADYFQTGWRQLAPLLENLAKGATCQATVSVEKVAQPYGGTAAPAAGWTFAATTSNGALTPSGPRVTGSTGTLEYAVRFSSPDAATAAVRIEERMTADQQAAGWSLADVSCTANGVPRPATRDGAALTLDVTVGDDVSCTFTNVQTREPGVEIVKRAWDVPTAAQLGGAAELAPGTTLTDGATVTWTYTVRNTGRTALLDIVVVDRPTVDVTCPRTRLEVGEHMVCTGSAALTPRP